MRWILLVLSMAACSKQVDNATPTDPIATLAEREHAPTDTLAAAKACDGGKPRSCMEAGSWFFSRAQAVYQDDRAGAARIAGGAQAAYAKACALYPEGEALKAQACRLVKEIGEERAK